MSVSCFRVVLDTNVIVGAGSRWLDQGIRSGHETIQRRVLIRVAEVHTGLYSGKIVGEYLEKLVDLGHPPGRALKLVTYIMGAFRRVNVTTRSVPVAPADPDDEVFLLCAIDGDADYLVSDDKAVTGLKVSYLKPIIGRCHDVAAAFGA